MNVWNKQISLLISKHWDAQTSATCFTHQLLKLNSTQKRLHHIKGEDNTKEDEKVSEQILFMHLMHWDWKSVTVHKWVTECMKSQMYSMFSVSSIALFTVPTWRQMQIFNKNKNVHFQWNSETPWDRMRSGSSIKRMFPQAQEKVNISSLLVPPCVSLPAFFILPVRHEHPSVETSLSWKLSCYCQNVLSYFKSNE